MKKSPRSKYEEKAGATEEDLIEALEQVVREDHPNPQRVGCPGKKALTKAATSPKHASQSVLNHIAKCAPCMKEYDRLGKDTKAPPRS